MDRVVGESDREVAPDGPWGALPALRGADHPPHRGDSVPALEDRADRHVAGEEADELAEERPLLVDAVELLGLGLGHRLRPKLKYLHAPLLEPAQYLADISAGDCVGLHDDEGLFVGVWL